MSLSVEAGFSHESDLTFNSFFVKLEFVRQLDLSLNQPAKGLPAHDIPPRKKWIRCNHG